MSRGGIKRTFISHFDIFGQRDVWWREQDTLMLQGVPFHGSIVGLVLPPFVLPWSAPFCEVSDGRLTESSSSSPSLRFVSKNSAAETR